MGPWSLISESLGTEGTAGKQQVSHSGPDRWTCSERERAGEAEPGELETLQVMFVTELQRNEVRAVAMASAQALRLHCGETKQTSVAIA